MATLSSTFDLVVEVVALAVRARQRQTRVAAVGLGDVVDEFHHVLVLPTPAPPNRPILPPLAKGADQVDHLDAGGQQFDQGTVRRTGAFGMDGAQLVAGMGPASSMGRPSTSMMPPGAGADFGTLIATPVFFTFMPRRRPSENRGRWYGRCRRRAAAGLRVSPASALPTLASSRTRGRRRPWA